MYSYLLGGALHLALGETHCQRI